MSRVMILANAPWAPTGYGVQGKHLAHNLVQSGHTVGYLAFYGLRGGIMDAGEYTVYPGAFSDPWGCDVLQGHMQHLGADTLISIMDAWVTPRIPHLVRENGWRWFPWTPVDSDPIYLEARTYLKDATVIPCYSQWGTEALQAAGLPGVYLPLGVGDAFQPGTSKADAKVALGFPADSFVVGMVAMNKTNPSRKCLVEQIEAFTTLPDDCFMYIHTYPGPEMGGVDLISLCRHLGIEERVRFPNPYSYTVGLDESQLPPIYHAFDFLSQVSQNEGFGLPLIEAQACGVPVVSANWSSMPELVFSGWKVKEHQRSWGSLNVWTWMPHTDAIARTYRSAYDTLKNQQTAATMSQGAAASVGPFRWPEITRQWNELL